MITLFPPPTPPPLSHSSKSFIFTAGLKALRRTEKQGGPPPPSTFLSPHNKITIHIHDPMFPFFNLRAQYFSLDAMILTIFFPIYPSFLLLINLSHFPPLSPISHFPPVDQISPCFLVLINLSFPYSWSKSPPVSSSWSISHFPPLDQISHCLSNLSLFLSILSPTSGSLILLFPSQAYHISLP